MSGSEWREAILADVTELPRLGSPGTIVVYGHESSSILTAPAADTVVAAAEYEGGRGVLFPQASYVKEFTKVEPAANMEQIIHNIKNWVSRGTLVSDSEMMDLNNVKDFDEVPEGTKVLIWRDVQTRNDTFKERLAEWVKNGGGIVFGANPWGYLQTHPENSLDDLPMDFLLRLLGVCYSTAVLSSGPITVEGNQAEDVNIRDIITKSMDDVGHLVAFRSVLESAVSFLPDTALSDILTDLTEMIEVHSAEFHSIPTKANPVSTDEGRALASLMNRLYIREGQFNGIQVPPGTEVFPGDFPDAPSVSDVTVSVRATGKPVTSHPTGFYLPAGGTLGVEVQSPAGLKNWSVAIGAHKDKLYNKDMNWRRWPEVYIKETITGNSLELSSPFGGLIYLISPNDSTDEVRVLLKNVLSAPYFDINHPETVPDWGNSRAQPGLWADICGEALRITMPAESVRAQESPLEVMELWDSVVHMHVDLRGMHRTRGRREWVVTDEQPSAGYMHSGYPIVTQLDVAKPSNKKFLLNAENLREDGSWGIFHELGHNMQDKMWTFSGTGEVTCNIFSMHAMELVTGVLPWEQTWLSSKRGKMETYLKAGADFAEWRGDNGVALAVYGQLARDMGWDVYKSVFREYDALSANERPTNDDDKIDQWIVRFSKNAGRNLCPMFDFWGFPIREAVLGSVQHLPAFLHSDETTEEMVPERAQYIREKYGMEEESSEPEEHGLTCNLVETDSW